ncbi:YibE/F family protein [Lacticaseibacillus daqingensis]|uniref:YibE/F family protein n=1 Tax=Lacticaseibacillus daqingensis TaxID=2486014 RepID=UPI000F78B67F|nr:YibE/F family protein [Lacticaseibacillus daqingensis]
MNRFYGKTISAKVKWGLPLLVFAVIFGLARWDAGLYRQPIGQVTAVRTTQTRAITDNLGNRDRTTRQAVTARLLNTEARGRVVHFNHTSVRSGAMDSRLQVGSQVFLSQQNSRFVLLNRKRDGIVLALFGFAVALLVLIMRRRFVMTALSILANIGLLLLVLRVDFNSHQVAAFGLFAGLAVTFTVVTALFVLGVSRSAAIAATATIGATAAGVALGYAVFHLTGYKDLHLEAVKYVTQAPQLLFFVQIIIGSLGAVFDECTDITAAVIELPPTQNRFTAGMAIGRSVMGPLIAVLFMIFIAETFTESVLWLRNGNSIAQTVIWVMGLGFAQSLVSAFGIVLAVPLTSGLATFLAKEGRA